MHTPVLLKEVIEFLHIKPNGLYIDATAGEGGYTKEIARLGGKVLAIDWDDSQVQSLKCKVQSYQNVTVIHGNFAGIEKIAKKHNFYPVDGIVFDLGLSMAQILDSGRGFSYKKIEEPLDMRIGCELEQTASDLINGLSFDELYQVLAKYSEDANSKVIAERIVEERKFGKIKKVGDLTKVIDKAVTGQGSRVYARIFQALRIAVNSELDNLKQALEGSRNILKPNGVIITVTFHSVEDRLVKMFAREHNLRFVNKKVIRGSRGLSFERSAKLRVIQK